MTDDFADWAGRQETQTDVLEPTRTNALKAALGETTALVPGDPLPLLHHWLYFWDVRPPAGLGTDGHPARGGFLPPVPLPRRMWAGGRVAFLKPLIVGELVTRTSTISKVETKNGKSGTLVFVTVEHQLAGTRGVAVIEMQDIVYRAASSALQRAPTADPRPNAAWQHDVVPDPVLLFRYSALTMNGHRIHYDRPYAMNEETYPALVVQGPLQATLLANLAMQNLKSPITGFEFRGHSPAFEGAMLHVCGEISEFGASLWTEQGGHKAMTATATCDQKP
jgi:3-methylfumaryl-CoA hydratase